jgi:hypothetical protein
VLSGQATAVYSMSVQSPLELSTAPTMVSTSTMKLCVDGQDKHYLAPVVTQEAQDVSQSGQIVNSL